MFSADTELSDAQKSRTVADLVDSLEKKIVSSDDDSEVAKMKMFLGSLKYQAKTFTNTNTKRKKFSIVNRLS